MLLKISNLPQNIKLCKVLSVDKIQRKSTTLDTFPKNTNNLSEFNHKLQQTLTNEQEQGKSPHEALINSCWRMVRACISDDGIGLAAPQIGIYKQMFVIQEDAENFRVYFHPRYTVDVCSKMELGVEGCLSVPGKRLSIPRATIICAEWLELEEPSGKVVQKTAILEGLRARVFQHEYDHLQGVSILDRARQAKTLK